MHGFQLKVATAPGRAPAEHDADPVPGRAPGSLHTAAQQTLAHRAVQCPGGPLPYFEVVQRAFGRHDISGIQAHTGSGAAAAARDMGADAFATGDRVVLGKGTDLFTVAHEAAHVVQQRAGVSLKGGVGEVGDSHEQHADAVASLVVQGKSAEVLLDRYTSGAPAAATAGVQHRMSFASYGDNYAYIIGILARHAFRKHRKAIRMHAPNADAVLAAIEAPFDMPHEIETMMKASKDFGDYDLENVGDLKRLFQLFQDRLPWQNHVAETTQGRLRRRQGPARGR